MKAGRIVWWVIIGMTVSGMAGYLAEHATVSSNVNGRELPICSVKTDKPEVALTFDVAWNGEDVEEILEILEEEEVKATFFVTGEWAKKHPDILKRMAASGHDLGNHSMNHRNMTQMSYDEKKKEILDTHEIVRKMAGVEMQLFRTPYGSYDDEVIKTADELGYRTIEWNIDTMDWKDYGANDIVKTVLEHKDLGNGAIIRAHGGTKYMAAALKPLIEGIWEKGLELVPVSELIYRQDYHMDVTGRQIPDEKN